MKLARLIPLVLALINLGAFPAAAAPVKGRAIVLVRGANFSAASWDPLRTELGDFGALVGASLSVYAPELYAPEERTTLAEVADRLCAFAATLDGPATWVGHSQGGAIITEAAAKCPTRVKRLVYLAAVFPKPGENVFAALSAEDGKSYEECGALDAANEVYRLRGFEACRSAFFADASEAVARSAYATMVPEPTGIGGSDAHYDEAAIAAIPKAYVMTGEDRIISPETQAKIILRSEIHYVVRLETSHSPFFSQPTALAWALGSLAMRP